MGIRRELKMDYSEIKKERAKAVLLIVISLIVAVAAVLIVVVCRFSGKSGEEPDLPVASSEPVYDEEWESEMASIEEEIESLVVSGGDDTYVSIIEANGGTIDMFDDLCFVLYKFMLCLWEERYEDAYAMYAVDLIRAAGYEYSYESFLRDFSAMRASILTDKTDKLVHYALWYKEYEHYYILYGGLEARRISTPTVQYVNQVERSWTIIPDGNYGYYILDFAFHEIDLVKERFDNVTGGVGTGQLR